jgi:cytochrome P450
MTTAPRVAAPVDLAFNPFDEATRRDPYALYARARREAPFWQHTGLPVVSAFRHADVQSILRDAELWSNDFRPVRTLESLQEEVAPSMLGLDAPEHTRLRALVSQAFTPRMVRRLEPRLETVAHELMDAALREKEIDFVDALAHPLPVIAIAEIIGVPAADRPRFRVWSDAAVASLGSAFFVPPSEEMIAKQRALLAEMGAYFEPLAEARRAEPREDLLTGLVQAELEGSRLSHDEMIGMLVLLLVAGNETTTNLIGNAALELLAHPGELERLRAEPALLPSAIEEVLRFASPVQMDPRRARRATTLGGLEIAENQMVISWIGSANRDEDVFPRAERFDIGREDNRHLSFGFGPHYCLGANLARLEAQVALRAFLARTRSFSRLDDAPLPMHPSIVFRGVRSLPLRVEAA